ncbi:hypothetical protein NDN08_003167 [Rhodosorus marinus]|uniref:Thioredoxin domain-containing protein n=1 Tax=Rhodosorus marinus TaxID=101924 RepID=A0AAV8UZD5_9RHOD|nr:hypothetical protein NDN08_003167 [Rhodosorus marinus]
MAFVHGPGLWKARGVSLASRPRYSVAGRCVDSFKPGILNEVTSVEDFDFLVESGATTESLVVIEFYAKWCKKCIKMMPRFRKIALDNRDCWFGKVDINAVGKLPRRQKIKEMPTFQIFSGTEKLGEVIGSLDADTVDEEIRNYFPSDKDPG